MMNQAVTGLEERLAVPWTECFILSLLPLLVAYLSIDRLLWLELIIFIPLFNIALYFVLKDKYDFESNALPYGIGFTAIFVIPLLVLLSDEVGKNPAPPLPHIGIFYIITFAALFYVFALFLLNKKTDTNKADFYKTVICLIIAAVLFFIIVSVYFMHADVPFFGLGFFTVMFLLLCLIGSCVIYLVINNRKNKRADLRKFVWVLFFCLVIETAAMFSLFLIGFMMIPLF